MDEVNITISNETERVVVESLEARAENLRDTLKTVSSDSENAAEIMRELLQVEEDLAEVFKKAFDQDRVFLEQPAKLSIDERMTSIEEKVHQLELFRFEKTEVEKLRSRLAHEKWSNRSLTIRHNKLMKDWHLALDEITARKIQWHEAHQCCLVVN